MLVNRRHAATADPLPACGSERARCAGTANAEAAAIAEDGGATSGDAGEFAGAETTRREALFGHPETGARVAMDRCAPSHQGAGQLSGGYGGGAVGAACARPSGSSQARHELDDSRSRN